MPWSGKTNFNQHISMDYYSLAPFLWSYFVPPSSSYVSTPHAQATQVWNTEWQRTDATDHKKGQVWATTHEWFGCDFHYFQSTNKTSVLFALHCSLTMLVKTTDLTAYFMTKNIPFEGPVAGQNLLSLSLFLFLFSNPPTRFLVMRIWYWFYYGIIEGRFNRLGAIRDFARPIFWL